MTNQQTSCAIGSGIGGSNGLATSVSYQNGRVTCRPSALGYTYKRKALVPEWLQAGAAFAIFGACYVLACFV